jgi:hypothetical protein
MTGIWVLHHIVAICQDCDWTDEYHGSSEDHSPVLTKARGHSRATGHYVQVERGQHAHFVQGKAVS